jgi:protein TonB
MSSAAFTPRPKKPNPAPWIVLALVVIGGGAWALSRGGSSKPSKPKAPETITITLPPPPPPPPPPKVEPPPPKDEPEQKDEMIEEEPVAADEPPPEAAPEAPPDEGLGTNITGGNGPDMGLSRGNGNGRIGGTGGKGGNGNRFGWYSAKVTSTVEQALRSNPITRTATGRLEEIRIWSDANGRITRVKLAGSTGNPAVDQAIKNQVLSGLQLPAPPADAPMPIRISYSARKSTP